MSKEYESKKSEEKFKSSNKKQISNSERSFKNAKICIDGIPYFNLQEEALPGISKRTKTYDDFLKLKNEIVPAFIDQKPLSEKMMNFKNNYDELLEGIKLIPASIEDVGENEEIDSNLKSLTSIEEIRDFYEYTNTCLKTIKRLKEPLCHEYNQVSIKNENKKMAIFDLDETLVHSEIESPELGEHKISINLPTQKEKIIGVNIRPNVKACLEHIKHVYTLVVFTASHRFYADPVLDLIDPKRELFKHRFYRNHCLKLKDEEFYIKDLRIFIKTFDLKDIVIIDNSVLSFAFHLSNGIPIIPFYGNMKDNEMVFLETYLLHIAKEQNIQTCNKKMFQIENVFADESIESEEDCKIDIVSQLQEFYKELFNKQAKEESNSSFSFVENSSFACDSSVSEENLANQGLVNRKNGNDSSCEKNEQ